MSFMPNHSKNANDGMGSKADSATFGNEASLRSIAQALCGNLKPSDIVPHWGSSLPANNPNTGLTSAGTTVQPNGHSGSMASLNLEDYAHRLTLPKH
jgi:hypothetical protein